MFSNFVSHLKSAALPTLAIMAIAIKLGVVQAGPSAPDMLKPAAK